MISQVCLFRAIIFALLYSIAENRLFWEGAHSKEWRRRWLKMDKKNAIGKFKVYHIWVFFAFTVVGYTANSVQWLLHIFLMPLILDFFWFIWERRGRRRDDWSNLGGFPLLFGMFVWYYVVAVVCLILYGIAYFI